MARVFTFDSGVAALAGLSRLLRDEGTPVSPRGVPTREFRNVVIEILDPFDAMSNSVGRNMNKKLAIAEALQLIGGFSDPEALIKIAPNTAQFRTGGVFSGAYGPRIRPQIMNAVKRLHDDPATRQAVVTVWDPLHDQQEGIVDIPCTISFNFHIRDGALLMTTHMRSNDIWWGWTYDVVQFTQLQCTIANVLDLRVGPYTHIADSLHVYERDFAAIDELFDERDFGEVMYLNGLGKGRGATWPFEIAQEIFYDRLNPEVGYTSTEQQMHRILHGR